MTHEFITTKTPSPRESMHSELLFELNKLNMPTPESIGEGHSFAIAAWLKLKQTHGLPALLIMEQTSYRGNSWFLVDTATVNNVKDIILLSGRVDTKEQHIDSLSLYLCHPNPGISVEVEELLFNGELVRKDYIELQNTAS